VWGLRGDDIFEFSTDYSQILADFLALVGFNLVYGH